MTQRIGDAGAAGQVRSPTALQPGPLARQVVLDAALSACAANIRSRMSATPLQGTVLHFQRDWVVGEHIGGGGFANVYEVESNGAAGAAKFIPKDPGAQRELLFADDLGSARNVVPVIDSGETEGYWVTVMPRAKESLRQWLNDLIGPADFDDGLSVIEDIATALADLDGRVTHRDVKPENILFLDGAWCLSDFGISRYVEATTSQDTRKFALSYAYAAPERWRFVRATTATDVYSLGIIAFELFAGRRPFTGPTEDSYREQHLHESPPRLEGVPPLLSALVDECMFKGPEARPTPANILVRVEQARTTPASPGLKRLQEAHASAVARNAETALQQSHAQSDSERRGELFEAAEASFQRLVAVLAAAIEGNAPSASASQAGARAWSISLGQGTLTLLRPKQASRDPWKWHAPAFQVIAFSQLVLRMQGSRGYEGRSHSLWFCDAMDAGQFGWFETAFMHMARMQRSSPVEPFALDPGEAAAKAIGSGMNEFQVAWPFTPLQIGALEDFIDRWANWFADAAEGRLAHPSSMPERQPVEGTWRRAGGG